MIINGRRKLGSLILLGLVAAGAVFFALRPREPVYQGKPLKVWLRAMECRPGWGESVQAAHAREAVVNMGSAAVPYLVKTIHQKGSGLNSGYRRFFYGRARGWLRWLRGLLPIPLDYPYQLQMNAAQVLGDMGPKAQPAVQALAHALRDPENLVRFNAAHALGSIGPGASSAISALIEALDENHLAPPTRSADFGGDWQVCTAAAEALGSIGAAPADVVPALTEALKSSHAETIMAACRSLATFGTKAESAVPTLLSLTQHAESNVRSAALRALLRIAPDAATKAGPQ